MSGRRAIRVRGCIDDRFGAPAQRAKRSGFVGALISLLTIALLSGCGAASTSGASSAASSPSTSASGAATSVSSGNTQFFASGTYKGQALQGQVTGVRAQCEPISVGGSSGVQVIWGGGFRDASTGKTEQMSGDMSFPQLGAWTIPNNDMHTPTASLVVAGDYSDRYGLSSGAVGGLGSGSLSANTSGGSIDATFSSGSESMRLSGYWNCV